MKKKKKYVLNIRTTVTMDKGMLKICLSKGYCTLRQQIYNF